MKFCYGRTFFIRRLWLEKSKVDLFKFFSTEKYTFEEIDHIYKLFFANILINGDKSLDVDFVKDGHRIVKQSQKSYIKLFMNDSNTF